MGQRGKVHKPNISTNNWITELIEKLHNTWDCTTTLTKLSLHTSRNSKLIWNWLSASFFWILQKTLAMLLKTQRFTAGVQGFQGTNSQANLHPLVVYFKDDQDFLQDLYYWTLSDCLNHDNSGLHAFICQMLCGVKALVPDLELSLV